MRYHIKHEPKLEITSWGVLCDNGWKAEAVNQILKGRQDVAISELWPGSWVSDSTQCIGVAVDTNSPGWETANVRYLDLIILWVNSALHWCGVVFCLWQVVPRSPVGPQRREAPEGERRVRNLPGARVAVQTWRLRPVSSHGWDGKIRRGQEGLSHQNYVPGRCVCVCVCMCVGEVWPASSNSHPSINGEQPSKTSLNMSVQNHIKKK